MDFKDIIIEFFLYHGIARVQRGFGYTVELAGRFLNADRETLPSTLLEETARRNGLTVKRLEEELRRFARQIGQKNGRLYDELVGERFRSAEFAAAVAEAAFSFYRARHTLLPSAPSDGKKAEKKPVIP